MKRSVINAILRWISIGLFIAAAMLFVFSIVRYSRLRSSFASGTTIAGVPVGGLTQQQTADRLTQAFSIPIEVHYGSAIIQIKPSSVGFEIDLEKMIQAADAQRVEQPFWSAFWDYLWNRLPEPSEIPLKATIDEARLRDYLINEVAARYDSPATAAMPVAGSINFSTGMPGSALDVERAMSLIEEALQSPTSRIVNLTYSSVTPPRPSFQNLQILLQQIIDISEFDGISEVYIKDLETGQELDFAYESGENLRPGVAFTAASTIKIPIMVSIYRRTGEPMPDTITQLIVRMIEISENEPADELMQTVIDPNLGPLEITQDMKDLGFENTFLAGQFYVGAPLLQRFSTPANSRTDVYTNPDVYNQTTPAELGMLLEDIYQCAESGGGAFAVVFPGEITQTECQSMLNYMLKDKIAVLLQAGLPDGASIAHKHGWIVESDGLMHAMTDAGIVYTDGGNYIMVVSMYHPTQLVFDPANRLFAQLSTAVYNYFTLSGK